MASPRLRRCVHLSVAACTTVLLLALTAAAQEGRQGWPQYGGGPARDNRIAEANAITYPKLKWHLADAHGQPTIGHGSLYSGGRALFRVDLDTGEILARWKPAEQDNLYVGAAPVLHRSCVIALVSDGRVFALKPDLSRVVWSREAPSGVRYAHAPAALDGDIYVHALGGQVVALDAASGTPKWTHPVDGEVNMSPAIHDGRVFVGTGSGRFLALRLNDGAEIWKYQGEAEFGWSDPAVAFGKVLVADRGIRGRRSGALNAFDEGTGKLLWSTAFGATGFSTPGIRDRVVVGGFGTRVAYFDPDTGELGGEPEIQTGMNAFGSPTIVGDTLYFGNLDGNFYACDARTGQARWTFNLPSGAKQEGNELRVRKKAQVHDFVYYKGSLYVSTTRGLYALHQDPQHEEAAPSGFVLKAD